MTPAIQLLQRSGITFGVHEYAHDPRDQDYGNEAVRALGLDLAQVFKTLMAELEPGGLAVAVVPVGARLDLKALATAAGAKRATLADPAAAQRATGYVLGGISPLGQRKRLPTFIDEGALEWDKIYVSAGRRGLEVSLAPDDLVALLRAICAPLSR